MDLRYWLVFDCIGFVDRSEVMVCDPILIPTGLCGDEFLVGMAAFEVAVDRCWFRRVS